VSVEKRYTVFVSSTYKDLIKTRDEIIKTLMRVKHIPLGMEAFNASNSSSWEIIRKTIDISDYYIIIVGVRYGSVHKTEKISYTEMEYNYATQSDVPCYVFIASDQAEFPSGDKDSDPKLVKKLADFKKRLMTDGRNIVEWNNVGDLTTKITAALAEAIADDPRPGWTRNFNESKETTDEMARLSKRNFELEEELKVFRAQNNASPILECKLSDFEDDIVYLYAKGIKTIREDCKNDLEKSFRLIIESREFVVSKHAAEAINPMAKALLGMAALNQEFVVSNDRINKVKDFTRLYDVDPSNFNWDFNLIGSIKSSSGYNGMPLIYTEATGGLDFEKYKLFQALERLQTSLSDNIKTETAKNLRFSLPIEIQNISRVAARDVKVEITFSDSSTRIDDCVLEKNTHIVSVANISPSDSYKLTNFQYVIDNYMSFQTGHYDELIKVKITGSNLPEASEYRFLTFIEIS
jgi:Domain of unknown function (DUF4062)